MLVRIKSGSFKEYRIKEDRVNIDDPANKELARLGAFIHRELRRANPFADTQMPLILTATKYDPAANETIFVSLAASCIEQEIDNNFEELKDDNNWERAPNGRREDINL